MRNHELVEMNMKLVEIIVNRYFKDFFGTIEKAELMQEGYIALIKAADSFDSNREIKFETYASTVIKNAITDCCRKYKYKKKFTNSIEDTDQVKAINNSYHFKDGDTDIEEHMTLLSLSYDIEILRNYLLELMDSKSKVESIGAATLLYYMDGCTQKDVADMYGLAPNYVRACVKRVREKMNKQENIVTIKKGWLGIL